MKNIILLLILGITFIPHLMAQPEEKSDFLYGSVGTIGGYPVIGGGYRTQYGYHGFDLSGKSILVASEVRALYLLYPQQKGIYLGTGIGFIHEAETLPHGSLSFDAVLGYQWKTAKGRDLFFQVEGIVPFKETCCSPVWPAITLGIGF